MTRLSSILSDQRIVSELEVSSKKKLLETVSEIFANELQLKKKSLFNLFFEREELSSTGLGNGFALPHSRIGGIDQAYGCLINLSTPINFDSVDNHPIDLVFALIVPEESTEEHLKLLASIAKMFSVDSICNEIRQSKDSQSILEIIQMNEQKG